MTNYCTDVAMLLPMSALGYPCIMSCWLIQKLAFSSLKGVPPVLRSLHSSLSSQFQYHLFETGCQKYFLFIKPAIGLKLSCLQSL